MEKYTLTKYFISYFCSSKEKKAWNGELDKLIFNGRQLHVRIAQSNKDCISKTKNERSLFILLFLFSIINFTWQFFGIAITYI